MSATVYRFYAENGDLLYVGCSMRLATRIGEHTTGKRWWQEATRATFEHFTDRRAALIAEARAIANEHPVHNTAGKLATWPNDDEREDRDRVSKERRERAVELNRARTMYRVPDLHCTNCRWLGSWVSKGKRPHEVACPDCRVYALEGTAPPTSEEIAA